MPTLEYKTALVEMVAAVDAAEKLLRGLAKKQDNPDAADIFADSAFILKERLNRFLAAEYRRTYEELTHEE